MLTYQKLFHLFPHSLFILHISKRVLSYTTLFTKIGKLTEYQDQRKSGASRFVSLDDIPLYVFYPVM